MKFSQSFVLKACIFATGLAGIVAEYVMSTLASYLLGNTVVQWTLTISLMLFAMGVGSRLSKLIERDLLDAFIVIELVLSLLCAGSALLVYFLAVYVDSIGFFIYSIAISIGLLIGLEVPIATRLNSYFEELRINISSVMEKDYYGALLGGLLFAFLALPHLGLTYTPIVLGTINFLVAAVLFLQHRESVKHRRALTAAFGVVPLLLIALAVFAEPVVLFAEQRNYRDRVVFTEQTPYQKIVITRWKQHFWLYLDGNLQFSSYDEHKYHEPLVHPAMQASAAHRRVLILGGGDGLAAREVLKYPAVERIVVVDIDPAVTELARNDPRFVELNNDALAHPKVQVINADAYRYVQQLDSLYDVIIVDLPDPKTVDLARLYSRQFYLTIKRHLSAGGIVVTQATSPFFSNSAFLSILKTMRATGLVSEAYHNHIPTMGEWGWVIGMHADGAPAEMLRAKLATLNFDNVETRFLNRDAMISMLHFGKGLLDRLDSIKVTDELDLAVYHYYRDGAWDLY